MGLIFIGLTGLFAYMCVMSVQEFKGSSSYALLALNVFGGLGYLSFFATSIWAFFVYDWWQVLIMVFLTLTFTGFVAPLFKMLPKGIDYILYLIGVAICNGMSIYYLIR